MNRLHAFRGFAFFALLLSAASGVLAQPANDNFANALVLNGAVVTTNGSTVGASREPGEPNHAGNPGARSVWFSWTSPKTGQIRLDTIGSTGGFNNNTLLGVYVGDSVDALTPIASNDDSPGLPGGASLLEFQATQGVTYRIAIDTFRFVQFPFTPAGGPYVLNLRTLASVAITAPLNGTVFAAGTPIQVDVGGEVPNPPITKVDFYRNGVPIEFDSTEPFSIVANDSPLGSNSFQIVALDSGGLSWTSAVVNVAVVKEGLTILSPADGAYYLSTNPGLLLSNPIPVLAYASGVTFTSVEFFVDGQPFGTDDSAPFSQSWSNVVGGSHRITAIGKSDTGVSYFSQTVNIGVNQLLMARGAVWKYLDDGSDQGTNWFSPDFDDGLWHSGPAELGYGDGDEATVVNGGPATSHFITTYFRRSFMASNTAALSTIYVNVKRDDGAIIYINGREAARLNMPQGTITYTNLAPDAPDDGTVYNLAFIPPGLVVDGLNVIAVELHQSAPNSSDISFDMDMAGIPIIVFNQPPGVELVAPTNDAVFIAPSLLTLEARANDPDGSVTKVEFYAGKLKIGESTNAPYTIDWVNPPLGLHALTAVATDDQGAIQPSAVVNVTLYDQAHTPFALITKPVNGSVVEGPTNMLVTAYASALEGVTNVLFLANGVVVGQDDSPPYSTMWNAPFGSNVLQAVAFGANGLQGTSVVSSIIVTIPPTNTVPPSLALVTPVRFAHVTNVFTNIFIRFSERVQNVDASDLLINGAPATGLTGSGSNYVFTFPQPPFGEVEIAFAAGHGITDFGYPSNLPFDELTADGRWEYSFVDRISPVIVARTPLAGTTVTNLLEVSVKFSEAVGGVDAGDLLVNGTPAFGVTGSGSDYVFNVSQPASGTVNITWATNHAITDLAEFPNAFNRNAGSATWNFTLDSRVILVQSNANWSFLKGTSEATTPIGRWREHDYDVDGWPVSSAPFFYGDPYTNALIQGTFLSDMRSNYSGIFLRKEFSIPNKSAVESLVINAQFDDGFIAWVNGFEVLRVNMPPTGEIPFNGLATTSSTEPLGAGAAYVVYTLSNAPPRLLTGVNVLTIQAFNQSLIGSDFGFNAQLYAFLNDVGSRAPRFIQANPAPGIIFGLTNLTITFSEPVEGVDATDLLVNGVPAQSVTSTNPAVYKFDFLQPPFGPVVVSWAPDHSIVDLDELPKPFNANASTVLRYTLYNPNAPTIAAQTPTAANTVTGLTSIAVRFSEAVAGVDASDLLVNGVVATGLSSTSSSNYIFTFPQPAFGPVTVRWAATHGIADLDVPPNDFDPTRPGSEWNYLLVNPVPTVSLTSPANSAAFLAPADILLQASASDNDGTIVRVEFFEGLNKIGERTAQPYSLTWSNVGLGEYTLQAVATDNTGLAATSAPVTISLVSVLPIALTRGPYLQVGTPSSAVMRWRTDLDSDAVIYYGTDAASLTNVATADGGTNEHIVQITGLLPDTKYYYSIGSTAQRLARGTNYWFITSPIPGTQKPTRFWVLGDSGTANENAMAVRDAYYKFAATNRPADLWLMLGDNAYNSGLDTEYQSAVFDMYPDTLRNLFLWPTIGNHETAQAFTAADFPYLHIFTLPQNGEAGGVPSGSPRYYSFDYANIHFVCLDSMSSGRTTNTAMVQWLIDDLASSLADWTVVFFHHPPYTKGSHNSDAESELIEIRQNILPILEANGVDLVLSGHSHCYERSYLLNGHYGLSTTLTSSMKIDSGNGREDGTGGYQKNAQGRGVVYSVAGSSGQISGGSLNHPAHFISLNELGSMVIDVTSNRLDAIFLNPGGVSRDRFTLLKRDLPPIANNGAVSTDEDTSKLIKLPATTPVGKPLSYHLVSVPSNGTVQLPDSAGARALALADGAELGDVSELIYTPNPDFHGTDGIAFKVSDGKLESSVGAVTITVAPINDLPSADASATPLRSLTAVNNVDAIAVLDGSRSHDIDNDPLQYFWSDGTLSLATGMVATVTLPIGSHNVMLMVSDGVASSTDVITIDVIAASVSAQPLIDKLLASSLPRNRINPLLATLDAANKHFQKGETKTAINLLNAFQNKVRAQLGATDPALAAQLIQLAQSIIDSVEPAPSPRLAIKFHGHPHKTHLVFDGLSAKAYVVEASADLIHWVPVGSAKHVGNGKFEFDDNRATNSVRFYRVQAP